MFVGLVVVFLFWSPNISSVSACQCKDLKVELDRTYEKLCAGKQFCKTLQVSIHAPQMFNRPNVVRIKSGGVKHGMNLCESCATRT